MTEIPACGQCGRQHIVTGGLPNLRGRPSCKRHRSNPDKAGQPCGNPPLRGQEVCRFHGGASPQAKKAAAMRIEKAAAVAEFAAFAERTLGEPILDRDPADIVAEQIAWRAGHVAWLRARVQAVDPDALIWGRTKEKIGGEDYGVTREARPNAWLQLYLEASSVLEKLCLDAISKGLEERRVRLLEAQADAIVRVLDGVLADLGHDPADPKTARIVERHLRLIS